MSYLALAIEIFWNDHRPSQFFFFFVSTLEPDEPGRPRRRGQRHSLDSKLLLANFHLLKYDRGHELNRKSETVTESCLHHNITDRAVALDGWNHVLSGHRAQLSARRGESCLHLRRLMLKRWQSPWGLMLRVKVSLSLLLTFTQIQMWKCAELCIRSIQENAHLNIIHSLHRSFDLMLVCSSPCICLKHLWKTLCLQWKKIYILSFIYVISVAPFVAPAPFFHPPPPPNLNVYIKIVT